MVAQVSIGIPVYNEGKYLHRTLASVDGQAEQIIICDNGSDFLTLFKTDEKGDLVEPKGEKIPVEINNHNTIKEFEIFADCIVNDKKVEMDGVEGARVVAICLAIIESSESGKIVIPNYEF